MDSLFSQIAILSLNFLIFFYKSLETEETTFRTEHTIKKEKIVKELAVNILELNDYKSRTEQLDKELKHCGIKLKNNQPDTWIANKSEVFTN